MAIQVRRGLKADFDPNKLLPGEFAAPLDTKELYLAYGAGDVKRMATYEDMQDNISEVTQDIVDDLTTEVKIATTNANTKAAYAQAKGDYAKEQGDYARTKGQEAQSVIDSAAPILNQNLQATYSDKGTVTGKFINFQFADDAMAQVNIKGVTTVTPANPDLPISPDNKATLVSAQNFDLVSNNGNWFNTDNSKIITTSNTTYDPIEKTFTNTSSLTWARLFNDFLFDVKPNTKYTFSVKVKQIGANTGAFGVYAFSDPSSNNPIAFQNKSEIDTTISITFTTTSSGKIAIRCNPTTGTVIENRKSVWSEFNLVEGTVATPYIPYKEDRINIPLPMRSLPNGVCDDIKDGKHIQDIEKAIFDGSIDEPWAKGITGASGRGRFVINISNKKMNRYANSLMCNNLTTVNYDYNIIPTAPSISGHNSAQQLNVFGTMFDAMTLEEFRIWLSANPIEVHYELDNPIITDLNTYLKTFKGITNIFTNATPQPEITATYKSQLWTDLNNHQKAIESKIDDKKRVNNLLSTDPTTVLSGPMGKQLKDEIDAMNNNMPKQINYWSDTQKNLLAKINDVSDPTFRTVIINGWDSVFTDSDMPYRNTVWHIAIYNNGRDINVWQRWTNLDNGSIYMRLYNPSSSSWGNWINNDLPIERSYVSKISTSYIDYNVRKIGKVVYVSALFITNQECGIDTPIVEFQDAPIFLTRIDLSIENSGSKRADFLLDKILYSRSVIPSGSTITMNFTYITS